MDAGGGADVRLDRRGQRLQGRRDRPHPVGQRGNVDLDALAGEAGALSVQRQVHPVLAEDHLGQKVGPGAAAGDRMERRRCLTDRFAAAAGDLLADVLDDEPARRQALERLGDLLAQLAHRPAAAGTGGGRRVDDAGARQGFGQRPARRLARRRGAAHRGRGLFGGPQFGGGVGLGDGLLQLGQRQLQLLEPGAALGGRTKPLPAQPGDLQLQPLDFQVENPLRLLCRGCLRLGFEPGRALGDNHRVRFGKVGGQRLGRRHHDPN